ncbi:hypothetical protein [Luteimonas vadosa]|uniref:Uncharacterized protein n=1 Tax=Luteimonas vadosa TaxID=1165507 RepID=A0ABP9DVP3_9GAMM
MNSTFNGYAVFFFPQALEALGPAIQPYLQDSPVGPHVLCRGIDTGGPLIELTLEGRTPEGEPLDLELMLPTSMVRMIVSARADQSFGFGPRTAVAPLPAETPVVPDAPGPALPAVPSPKPAAPRRGRPSPAGRAAAKASAARKRPAVAKQAKAAKKTKKPGDRAGKKSAAAKAATKKAGKPRRAKKAR